MPHKEHYHHTLPHFQRPGQAYFITWSLKDTVPPKALKRYTQKLQILKSQLDAAGTADSIPPFGCSGFQTADFKNADRNPHHPESATPGEKLHAEHNTLRNKILAAPR